MVCFRNTFGWLSILAAVVGLIWAESTLFSAEETTAEKKASQETAPAASTKRPINPYRRLPPYYKSVITPEQCKQIYAIQEEYGPKIDALRAQLEALIKERDEKIAALLSEQQRKEVERLQQEAKAKQTRKEKGPSAESKPDAPSEKTNPAEKSASASQPASETPPAPAKN